MGAARCGDCGFVLVGGMCAECMRRAYDLEATAAPKADEDKPQGDDGWDRYTDNRNNLSGGTVGRGKKRGEHGRRSGGRHR